jgi:hypothetical protein
MHHALKHPSTLLNTHATHTTPHAHRCALKIHYMCGGELIPDNFRLYGPMTKCAARKRGNENNRVFERQMRVILLKHGYVKLHQDLHKALPMGSPKK